MHKSFVVNDCGSAPKYNINPVALFNLINIVLIGIFYLVIDLVRLDRKLIYKTICFIGIFQATYVILQVFGLDEFFKRINFSYSWPVGTWANEGLCSWCITLCSPFFLAFKDLRFKIGYVICFIAILCTKVSAGILGFIIGYLFWAWHKSKKTFWIMVTFLVMAGAMIGFSGKADYYFQDTHRLKVWEKSIAIWKDRPLTGYGLGSFRTTFMGKSPEFQKDGYWAQAHNEYLQILYEEGIIGLGIIIALMFTTALSFYRTRKGLIPFTALIVGAFVSIFSFPFHTAMGGIIILALVMYEKERGSTKSWLKTFVEDYKDELEEI